jgi:hypothetical protein
MIRNALLAGVVVFQSGTVSAQATSPPSPESVSPVETPTVIEAPTPKQEQKPRVEVSYATPGVLFESDDGSFEMKLMFRNQVRFESSRSFNDETPTRHNQFLSRFLIPRSRLQAEGHVFGEANRYKVELGMDDAGSFSFIKDMYIEKALTPANDVFFRFGQWKRPFNRMEMVSDFSSTFNERSIENELAGGGRDVGFTINNEYEQSPEGIGFAVGLFNRTNGPQDRPTWTTACEQATPGGPIVCVNSRPTNVPVDFEPAFVARVDWNSPKIKGYSESDLEGGPLRYAVGASWKTGFANFSEGNRDSWYDNMSMAGEVDTIIKAYGFCFEGGFLATRVQSPDWKFGFYVQPSYLVIDTHLEVAGRFAWVQTIADAFQFVPPQLSFGRDEIETRAAVNWYFHGHTFKVSSDGGFLLLLGDEGDPAVVTSSNQPNLQLRVMLQLQI